MKSAVASRSSAAMRRPPTVIRGTSAVAVRPTRLTRRSSILFASLARLGRGIELVEDDTDKLALGTAKRGEDVFHGFVDVEVSGQHGHQRVGCVEQLAV